MSKNTTKIDDGSGDLMPINGWRRQRIAAPIHTKYTTGCPICNNMLESGSSIIPHLGQA